MNASTPRGNRYRFYLSRLTILLALPMVFASSIAPALAWNATGHKAISLLAYQLLTPAVRQRIDGLLAKHPDYPKWVEGVPADQRGRAAFLAASVWPDNIRNDPRFHNDDRPATAA